MKRAGYREAIRWIVYNDDISDVDRSEDDGGPLYTVTMCLVADIFDVETERVLRDVVRCSKRMKESDNG